MKTITFFLLLISVSITSVADTEINVSAEIRYLFSRFNSDKTELIKQISLTKNRVNSSLKMIDPYARWFSVLEQTNHYQASNSAGIGAD